jgi:hypothetical protein
MFPRYQEKVNASLGLITCKDDRHLVLVEEDCCAVSRYDFAEAARLVIFSQARDPLSGWDELHKQLEGVEDRVVKPQHSTSMEASSCIPISTPSLRNSTSPLTICWPIWDIATVPADLLI